ncbi:hypothetical protein [Xenophilus sp.]|uniref:hypothetical protein n=1 Tax=Xenophilus sp. TaxID=1873499 RepID=UPI0037DD2C24
METLKTVAYFFGVIAFGMWLFRRSWLEAEIRRNDSSEAPSDQQIRWHIRHLREDMHALVLINYTLLIVVAAAVVFEI